jgi:hypothetical protein
LQLLMCSCAPSPAAASAWLSLQGLKAAGLDGVLLGGNYVAGVALGKCVEYGFEFAEQVSKYVDAAAPAKQKVAA